ncbi:zinc finger protein 572-like [Amblyraja radiata]|uniref:zinc finger protein 572-like n=1 Tax=Amblyraja radiata TaxID=386614 RepID=UPI0014036540|nr:zinc finger protein 572-like [Amblyraja radiata]
MKDHMTGHDKEKRYECDVCGKKKPLACSDCGKGFKSTNDLKIHRRVHTGERPYGCAECGKSFKTTNHLKSHQRVHTGELLHLRFKSSPELKMHRWLHTGERPYICSHCGKSFIRSARLLEHWHTHTDLGQGERSFAELSVGFLELNDSLRRSDERYLALNSTLDICVYENSRLNLSGQSCAGNLSVSMANLSAYRSLHSESLQEVLQEC